MNKKGQNMNLGSLQGVIWTLVTIGIMLVVGLTVLDNLEETADETVASADVLNQANTTSIYNNVTAVAFANATLLALDDITCSLYNFTNHTTGTLIGATNYTVGGDGNCYATMTDDGDANSVINGTGWNVTFAFVYDEATDASTAAASTITATADIADWLPVIVVIIIAAVILGLVYFFRRSGE